MQTKIKDLISEKQQEVVSVNRSDVIDDVVKVMNERHIGSVIVMDGDAVVGVLTERDLLKKLLAAHKDASQVTAGEIMTEEIIVATLERTIEECMTLMANHHIRHLPVFDGKKLAGMISVTDLMKRVAQDQKAEVHMLQDFIAGPYG